MALDVTKPTDSQLLINTPSLIRANWDAIVLGTDATLLVTNAKVAAAAAITESKILFAATGHGHTGSTDGKQIVLTTGVSGTLPVANGGTNSTSTPNTANGIVVLDGTAKLPAVDGSALTGVTSRIVQIVNTQTGAVATGTTVIPADDTIPQITEGDEYMTLAITPTSATNKLKIEVVWFGGISALAYVCTVALFKNTDAGALAAGFSVSEGSANLPEYVYFAHYMTSDTTSAITFRVRAGLASSATLTFNGFGGARLFGGVMASSITITEIAV